MRTFSTISTKWFRDEWQRLNKWEVFFVSLFVAAGTLLILEGMRRVLYPTDEALVVKFSQAIAKQEGFGVPGALPTVYHNPGDLTKDLIGKSVGVGKQNLVIFANDAAGWENLYAQVRKMFNGLSLRFSPSMTLAQVGAVYAEDPAWAHGVATILGVPVDTKLSDLKAA